MNQQMRTLRKPKNFTQAGFSFLPDAPTIVVVGSYEAASPFHIEVDSKEEGLSTLVQIKRMAIAFVVDFSKRTRGKLDFSLESLPLVDEIIGNFKSKDQGDIEVFVAECGSYIGEVLAVQTRGKGKWHPSFPKYIFSGFRLPFKIKDKKGNEETTIAETNSYAAVSKRLISLWEGREESEPTIREYVSFIVQGIPQ